MPSPWTMPDSRLPEGASFLASIARLQAAGLIESVVHDAATGEGRVSFTRGYLRLLKAGRVPSTEPGFVATWLTGDPLAVRAGSSARLPSLPKDPRAPTVPPPEPTPDGLAGDEPRAGPAAPVRDRRRCG
jgi:hypothetical protein